MGFAIEFMVFLIISSVIMLFIAPTNEVILSRKNIARDVSESIADSDIQKAINSEAYPPTLVDEVVANSYENKDKLKDNAIIYNKLDQEVSQKKYSDDDIRYSVRYTKKTYEGQEVAKDSRWMGNIRSFNYKVNNKLKLDEIVEDYLNDVLSRNGELDINDIPKQMRNSKERNIDKEEKYNDKNKLMIINNISMDHEIEIWDIEYIEINDIKKEYGRYVVKYDIVKGKIELDKSKESTAKENLKGMEYELVNTDIKKNRLVIQIN